MIPAIQTGQDIYFVTLDQFKKLPAIQPEEGQYIFDNFTIENRVRLGKKGKTWEALICNIVGLHNRCQLSFSHLVPKIPMSYQGFIDMQPADPAVIENIEKELNADWTTLQHQAHALRGLLVGGKRFYKASLDHLAFFHDWFQEKAIPFTFFWGQRRGTRSFSNAFCDAPNNRWVIHTQCRGKALSTLQDLRQAFRYIQIAPGDRVFIQNQEVTDALRNREEQAV